MDRMRQVNEEIHRIVAEIVARDVELPLDTFVTVTHVQTSKDLRHSSIFLTVLPDAKRVSTIKVIERASRHIQRIFGQKISLKFTPKLQFHFDEGEIRAQKIYDALDQTDPLRDPS